MALPLSVASSITNPFNIQQVSFDLRPSFIHRVAKPNGTVRMSNTPTNLRRSANYKPTIWKYEFLQSLSTEFTGEKYERRFNELKQNVRNIMSQMVNDPLKQLEFIDTLLRLGISYHFENEIKDLLKTIYNNYEDDDWKKNDLYATALEFRLLRQHEFHVSQDVFNNFKDETSNFSTSLYEHLNGMLSLYEASFLSIKGEKVLEEARYFASDYLEKYIKLSMNELDVSIVKHALELPLHWRMSRLEARWFIDIYERREDMNPILLEIAKLDFNMVQSIHQEDLKYTSSWWKSTKLGEKLSFARDRLMECFLWTVGIGFEPEFSYFRRMSTKIIALITVIDDIYDVYGTLDELELFTDVIERWDVTAMDQLPDYMKICFLALHNSVNEMAYDILRDQGVNVIQYLRKTWVELCKCYMLEAKWYNRHYEPTFQEFLDHGWISISGPVMLVHAYVLVTSRILKEDLENLMKYGDLIRLSSTILRLVDDLATSSDEVKRGDIPKSVQCYMKDFGTSENSARKYIKHLIGEAWKELNKIKVGNSILSKVFVKITKNVVRMAQCMYQYGDGHGIEDEESKNRVTSLLIQPIPHSLV